MFVTDWASKLEEVIALLEPTWQNENLIEEILESIGNIPTYYFEGDLEAACDVLRGFLATNNGNRDNEPDTKRVRSSKRKKLS